MRRVLAAIAMTLLFGACTSQSGTANDACAQFHGDKHTRCEKGMDEVSSAVDEFNNNGGNP